MRRYPVGSFYSDCEPLVRRAIAAMDDPQMRNVSSRGKFIYLVRDSITQKTLDVNRQIANAIRSHDSLVGSSDSLEILNRHLVPFVGRTLLRCGIWFNGLRHEMYIDESLESVVHSVATFHPDPDYVAREE